MPRLQVVTIDGTVIEADKFQEKKRGLKLDRKTDDGKSETIGFVPFDRMMYVIPEDVTHNIEEMDELPV